MAEINLNIGVDVESSLKPFEEGVQKLVDKVNSNPPKVRIQLEDSTLKTFEKQLNRLILSINAGFDSLNTKTLDITNRQLEEIREDAYRLASALPQAGSALSKMGKEGSQGTDELYGSLQSISQLIDQINSKDFSVSNVFNYTQKSSKSSTSEQLKLLKQEAKEYYSLIEQIVNVVGNMMSISSSGGLMSDFRVLQDTSSEDFSTIIKEIYGFNDAFDKFDQRIKKTTSVNGMSGVIADLQEYYEEFKRVVELGSEYGFSEAVLPDESGLNSAIVAIENFNKKGSESEQIFLNAAAAASEMVKEVAQAEVPSISPEANINRQGTPAAQPGAELKDISTITQYTDSIKEMCAQVTTILDELRTKIEQIFDLSTVNMNSQSVIDTINQIKDQLNGLQINVSAAATATAIESAPVSTKAVQRVEAKTVDTSSAKEMATTMAEVAEEAGKAADEVLQISASLSSGNEAVADFEAGLKSVGMSTEQIASIESIFEDMGVPVKKLTATLKESTDAAEKTAKETNEIETATENASKAANEIETSIEGAEEEAHSLVQLLIQGSDDLGKTVKYTVTYDTETGDISNTTTKLEYDYQKAAKAAKETSDEVKDIAASSGEAVNRVENLAGKLNEINKSFSALSSQYTAEYKQLGGASATGEDAAMLEPMKQAYIELGTLVDDLKAKRATATEEDIQNIYNQEARLQELINTAKEYSDTQKQAAIDAENKRKQEEAEAKAAEKAAQAQANKADSQKNSEQIDKAYRTAIAQLNKAINDYASAQSSENQTSKEAYQDTVKYKEELEALYKEYDNATDGAETLMKKIKGTSKEIKDNTTVIKANGDAAKTLSDRISDVAQRFSAWFSVSQAIMLVVRSMKQMVTQSIEVEDAMTQLRIVTNETEKAYSDFADTVSSTAQKISASMTDLINATTTYARLGYNMEESSTLAQYTAMLQNVGDIEAEDAQEAVTSIVKAYNVGVDEIEGVMDELVAVGNNFPISVSEIAAGMTNASSTLAAAGNSLEESIALLTAANTTMQNISKASTGLRTITARIRNTSTELDELGETMTSADYEKLVQALTSTNVALTTANGEFRSTYEIMSDIAAQWDTMTSMEQAALAETLSGTRQQSIFYSIIEQFQEASGAMDTMAESAGTLTESYNIYLDSTTAHINTFKAAFQGLGSDLFDSDFLQFFVDLGTAALNFVDNCVKLANTLGGLRTALIAVAGAIVTMNIDTLTTRLGLLEMSIQETATKFVNLAKQLPKVAAALYNVATGAQSVKTAFQGISATTIAAAFTAIAVAVSAVVSIFKSFSEQQAAARQETIDAGKAAADEAQNIITLYDAYDEARKAYDGTAAAEENLTEASEALLTALGYESGQVTVLSNGYATLDDMINGVTVDSINSQLPSMIAGYREALEELENTANGTLLSSGIGLIQWTDNGQYKKTIANIAKEAGYEVQEIFDANTGDIVYTLALGQVNGIESIENIYNTLNEISKGMVENIPVDALVSLQPFNEIQDILNSIEEEYGDVMDLIDSINKGIAYSSLIEYEGQNGIPQTVEEFNALKNALYEVADAEGSYAGSQSDMISAINYVLSNMPSLSEFVNNYSDSLNRLTDSSDRVFELTTYLTDTFMDAIDSYQDKVSTLQDALASLRDNELSVGDTEFSELVLSLKDDFPELMSETDRLDDAICELIDDLNTQMISKFAEQFEDVNSEEARKEIQKFEDIVLQLGEVVGNTQFIIDFDAEVDGMKNFYTALSESASATGLSSDSIANLKDRYKDLEKEGYNLDNLFEKTVNGVRINTTAVRELESAYESSVKNTYATEIQDLVDEYNELTDSINNASSASKLAELYARRDDIKEQLSDITLLATQYDGLTSSYNKWLEAQSTTDQNDMYLNLSSGIEGIKDLYEEGWIGIDDFRSAVQMMTDTDMSTATTQEILDMYEKGISTMELFFDGTTNGLLEFLNVADDVTKELGETWVTLDDNGFWTIDLGVNGDEELVNAINDMTDYQMSVQELQILLRAMEAAGFVVHIDSEYSDLDLAITKAEELNQELVDLGKIDTKFNFNVSSVEEAEEEIEKAKELYESLVNSDDEVDIEVAEDVWVIFENLIALKQSLTEPSIMEINLEDYDILESDLTDGIELLQQFVSLADELDKEKIMGLDTTETENNLQSVAEELEKIPDEVWTTIGIDVDETNFNETLQNIIDADTPEIETGFLINQDDVDAIYDTIESINKADIEAMIETNFEDVISHFDAIESYEFTGKTVTLTISGYEEAVNEINYISSLVKSLTGASVKINVSNDVIGGTGGGRVNGTAHVKGTAEETGDWGASESGTALGGELGQELVVRDGRYFTVGDKGAEFFDYKKGDIIFNADQTAQLFEKGKITYGRARGKALVDGTIGQRGSAFSSGHGQIIVGGQVVTTPSSATTSSGSSAASDADDFLQTLDWIEIKIDRIERAIDDLDLKASSTYKTWSSRNKNLSNEISDIEKEIEIQAAGYERYLQQAESVGLDATTAQLVRTGAIDISTITDEDLYDKITEYQDWYEKALDCAYAVNELYETEAKLYETAFNNVVSEYEAMIQVIDYNKSMIDEAISQAELSGRIVNTEYYSALIKQEQANLDSLESEKNALTKALQNALDSGTVERYSEAWYDMCNQIDEVTLAIEQSTTAMMEYANSIRDIQWSVFDLLQSQISNITTEANFLIDLLSNDNLYDERGQLTNEGLSTMGLHAVNYDTYMAQADKYAEEMLNIDKSLANDPYNQDLIDRREELLELQQESILAAEEEKQAIVDMVEEGIELELSALKELIDTYEDALDAQKDLYDYQKSIASQTSTIADIEKQLSAYAGDTSEETRATIQRLQNSLTEAQENLRDTEYKQYIADQKELLDNLYDEYEAILNSRLDDIDALISDMIDTVNINASLISDTLSEKVESVGYTMTDQMTAIWSANADELQSVVSMYGTSFMTGLDDARLTLANVIENMSAEVSNYISNVDTDIANGLTSVTNEMSSIKSSTNTIVTNMNTIISSLNTIANNTALNASSVSSSSSGSSSSKSSSSSSSSSSGSSSSSSSSSTSSSSTYSGNLNIDTSIVDRLKWQGMDSSFSNRAALYKSWIGNDTYTGSSSQNVAMLNYMKSHGMASGGFNIGKDELYFTQENGTEAIIRPSDGAILTPLAKGDSVLSAEATKAIFDFANDPAGFLMNTLGLKDIDMPQINKSENNEFSGDINVGIDLPNVTNYDEFKYALQHDRQFEDMMRAMTTDRIFGGSALKKYKR